MASLLVSILLTLGQAEPTPSAEPVRSASDVDRGDETVRMAHAAAARYRIVGESPQTPLTLQKSPILKWSNANDGSLFGSVELWTAAGRPAAVASFYRWYVDQEKVHAEFKSLSPGPLQATRDGETAWDASSSDIKFQLLKHDSSPSDSPQQRLRQMREIARRFSAAVHPPGAGNTSLRLLTQPLYRYEQAPAEVIDGALFAFAQGTDPEVLLLLEAQETPAGAVWNYAIARLNMYELSVMLDEKEVWRIERLPWSQASVGRGPYCVMKLEYHERPDDSHPAEKP
jgi:hypothetical protein